MSAVLAPVTNSPTERPDDPTVAVVVCAYTSDRWEDLEKVIGSLHRQTVSPDELVIVVDHNPALFRQSSLTFGDSTVIENRHARGLSGARNSGVEASRSDLIAFIDDDAIAETTWLERLVESFHQPDVVAAGGTILPAWDNGRPSWFPSEFNWVVGCTYLGMPQTNSSVRNVIGANMAFRRSTLNDAGLFRTEMGRIGSGPAGCEETELCIRCRHVQKGADIRFVPDAVVHHRVPAGRTRISYFIRRCYGEGTSKARVATLVGQNDGLASERTYVMRTLPAGMLQGFADGFRGDVPGILRAFAIPLGFASTCIGYVIGRMKLARSSSDLAVPLAASGNKSSLNAAT